MIRIFTTILLLVACVAAQEQVSPPAQVMQPADTVAINREMQKITPTTDQIELPEVVVIGEDRSRRVAENKVGSAQSGPRLIMPTYNTFSAWERRRQLRPNFSLPAALQNQWVRFGVEGGSFATVHGDVHYGRRLPWGMLQGSAFLHRSDGAYENSQYLQGGMEAQLNYALRDNLQVQMQVGYEGIKRGLYGAIWPTAERRGTMAMVAAGVSYRFDDISSTDWQLNYHGIRLSSHSHHQRIQSSASNLIGLNGRYSRDWHKIQFNARIDYWHEWIDPYASEATEVSFSQMVADIWLPLSSGLTMNANLGLQSFGSDSLHNTRFSPAIGWRFLANPNWGFSLKMASGMRYLGYHTFAQINPYMAHSFPLQPQEEKFSLSFVTEFKPKENWSAQAMVGKSWLNRYLYWQRQKETGLIGLRAVKNPEVLEMKFRCEYRWHDRGHLQMDFATFSDKVLIADSLSGKGHLPYLPAVMMTLQANYEIFTKLYLTIEGEFAGDRFAQLQGKEKLASYGLLNFILSKDLNSFATIFLSLNNILNSRHQLWQGYQQVGFNIIAGARLRF